MHRFLSALAILSTLILGAAPQHAIAAERTLTIRIPDEPETLDWNRAHTTVETYILLNIMEGLVSFDSNLKVTPLLAKSWTISPDGKTYTFNLRPDVKWTDGVPLKAADFVYSWRRLLSPLTAASEASILFDIAGAQDFHSGKLTDPARVGIKALDSHTLQVQLTHPVTHWIYTPTFWVTFPVRQDVVEKNGTAWATPGRMVTLGPYRLVSHDVGEKYVLAPNRLYHGKMGNVQKLVFQIEKNDDAAMDLYEKGKIDFLADITNSALKHLIGRADLKSFPYLTTAYLGFGTGNYPMDDANVRRAIAMAIDRDALAKLVYEGKPATSFVPPPMLGHLKRIGLKYDPAQAKIEFKKSGLDPYERHSISLILPDWEREKTVAAFIKTQLEKNLPLTVNVVPLANQAFRLQIDLRASPMFLGHWGADYPDPDNFLSLFLNEGRKNRFGWQNSDFEKEVIAARGIQDTKKRGELYESAQKILLDDQSVVVPLYYEPKVALVKPRVHGLVINALNYLYLGNTSVDP